VLRNFGKRVTSTRLPQLLREAAPAGSRKPTFEPLEPRMMLDGDSLVITEFMAQNTSGLTDQDGAFSDWIEIYNPTGDTVDLDGWYLTDKDYNLTKWPLPAVSIDPGNYLLVFASEKDRSQGELHTNFKLADNGEYLALVREHGVTLQVEFAYEPEYPTQYANVSYGLSPDFVTKGYFTSQTPQTPNVIHQVVINEIMYHPASENVLEEYIELFNRAVEPVNLAGWQFTSGIDFTIPDVPEATIAPGEYLLIVADETAFGLAYTVPEGARVIGNWDGRLSNRSEEIELVNSSAVRVDRVHYADEGDWATREEGAVDLGHTGWTWAADHDGGGQSLELINLALSNKYGQNWASSNAEVGPTPGQPNSVAADDIAPMILDVAHSPMIPRSDDPVTVTARLKNELVTGQTASVHYRVDGEANFFTITMSDDGAHGDGKANDGVYGAVIPAADQLPPGDDDGTIVEFYVTASDGDGSQRAWPAPTRFWPDGAEPVYGQLTNLLYQVDDNYDAHAEWDPEVHPAYRLIMTEAERDELEDIGNGVGGSARSNAQMNGTFISVDGVQPELRYNVGIRNRGNGSRTANPNNHRVNFPHDRPWQDVTAININSRNTYYQHIGHTIFRMAGLPAEDSRAVRVWVNGENLSISGSQMYGHYVQLQAYDSDFADSQFPDDSGGNLYSAVTRTHAARLEYLGTNPQSYINNGYSKATNASENDWSDLIHMTDVLNNEPDATYVEEVAKVIDVDQWLKWFAIQAFFANSETNLGNGVGDDYAMYRGVEDTRFVLLPHDMDSILSVGRGLNDSIYRATTLPAIERFLTHPEFSTRYHATMIELIETVFSPQQMDPLLEHALGGYVPAGTINTIRQWVANRCVSVLGQIEQNLTLSSDLPTEHGYAKTGETSADLEGTAHVAYTRSVLVNGQVAEWDPHESNWVIGRQTGGETDVLVPEGALWSYLDDGSDQGTAWREPDFVPQEPWAEGEAQLGYGDGDETTVVGYIDTDPNTSGPQRNYTTYFRRSFEITDASQYAQLTVRILRDDGAVVYLNGHELLRSNIQEGIEVDYQTRAWSNIYGGGERSFRSYDIDTEYLVDGTNVLAVEVHNFQPSSRDISFDLQLRADLLSNATGVLLNPGINRAIVDAYDGPNGTGNLLERRFLDIWYDDGNESQVAGTLGGNTVWNAAAGPWHVTGEVTVPAGATLSIEPGTTVFFDQGTRLTVEGRLVAEGTEFERIRLTRVPGSSATWDGLFFNSAEDNRLAHLDMEYSSAATQSIGLDNSKLSIDAVTWAGTDRTILNVTDSSLVVRNSVFPDTVVQTVAGRGLLPADPYMLFDHNVFGVCTGDTQDVVDFSAVGSTTMPRFVGNVFLGGRDAGLDLDGTNAYIEGNIFRNFRSSDPVQGEAYAITTGYDSLHSSHHAIVRNFFIDCDNAVLVKDRSWIDFDNNTVVDCDVGISFDEPLDPNVDPGEGAYLDGNIFADTTMPLANLLLDDPVWGATDLTVNRSIVPAEYHGYGVGNVDEAPRLDEEALEALTTNDEDPFSLVVTGIPGVGLLSGSPALGTGPNGIDMGATVPAGASISGVPSALTARTDAALIVAGPGVSHFRYRLDENPTWSAETAVDAPIELAGLADGDHTLRVVGKSTAGIWQDETDAAVATWHVDSTLSRLQINEVLAINSSAVEHEGGFPDLIELFNDGPLPVDLAGMSISDNEDDPAKFVFPDDAPVETTIPAHGYLVLHADNRTEAPGLHLGFSLDGDGDGVFLFDTEAKARTLVDTVEFGLQIPDLSTGRVGDDHDWGLTQPTFGTANLPARTGNPATLKINEWLADGDVLFDEDFIELYNPDPLPVSLGGLFLTDDHVARPGRHQIAPLSYTAGEGFTAFIADGDTDNGPNHLGFRLSPGQELLGLYDANLQEIDKVAFFPQTTDFSQGRQPDGADLWQFYQLPTPGLGNPSQPTTNTQQIVLAAEDADKRALVPEGPVDDAWRTDVGFDDSLWTLGTAADDGAGGVGYDRNPSYQSIITIDFEEEMYGAGGNNSCLVRIPFTLDADPGDFTELTLMLRYDDGMRAYLNGVEITEARLNFNDPPDWDANATGGHEASAVAFDPILDISDYLGDLQPGENLLALHAANDDVFSSDFLISAQLEATISTTTGDSSLVDAIELFDGLRITEIMYNPRHDDDAEFIELQNVGNTTLDLTGMRFTEGVDFTFPPMLLAPDQYVVVARDREAFELCYGPGINVAGQYSGNLDNGGEEIVLQLPAPLEAAVMRFDYNDSWRADTDGGGFALEVRDTAAKAAAWDDADAWHSGPVEGGTPGWDGSSPDNPSVGVVINEVLSHTDDPWTDTIELYNTTDAEIDVGGWYLSDSDNNYLKFRIPDDTPIAAGGYLIFDEGSFNPTPTAPGPDDFALDGAHGDQVYLVEAKDGKVSQVVDFVVFGGAANGESFGRWPNGMGNLYPMNGLTLAPAGENSGPRAAEVIISEVHYNPGSSLGADNLEFVEIINIASGEVDLTNWRLRKGIDFDFPDNTTLATGSVLVVVPFDTNDAEKLADFRTTYALDASVQVLGGYSGQLGDNGDRVQLQRPDLPPLDEPDFFPHILEDEVVYGDVLPWPVQADGSGNSLNRAPTYGWGNDAASWFSVPPNPGSVDAELPPLVVARHVFYNNSSHDGDNPAANASDDQAIADDKRALLPGQTASFANYTSYHRGINGVMVDIHALPAEGEPGLEDFQFRAGTGSNVNDWTTPSDPQISVRRGDGPGGADRLTIIWDDFAIVNQWLQVTVLATAATGLRSDDVFYFGNAVAESGNSTDDTRVNAADILLARNNPRNFLNPSPVDFDFDYNRDGRVNATDMLLARNNQTHLLNALPLFAAPHGKAASGGAQMSASNEAAATKDQIAAPSSPAELDWLYALTETDSGGQSSGKDNSPAEDETAAALFWMVD